MMPVRTSPQNDQLQSRLARIPPELLDRITRDLPTPSLGNLRLSCKLIERRLFSGFAKEFFGKKQYMLTHFSLQTLIDISRHEDISPYVTEIQIGTDRYMSPFLDSTDQQDIVTYRRERGSQFALLSGGFDRDMLAEAFSNLPNLNRIVIRDLNSRARHRDFDPNPPPPTPLPLQHQPLGNSISDNNTGQWRSYGALTANKGTTMQARPVFAHDSEGNILTVSMSAYVSRIWLGVFSAMAVCSTVRPKHVELLLRQYQSCVLDENMDIPDFLVPKLAPVLQDLQVLHLRIGFSDTSQDYFGVQRFLCMTPNLKHLRINLCDRNRITTNGTRYLLRWLAHDSAAAVALSVNHNNNNTVTSGNLPAPMDFPRLEQLDLGDMKHAQADDLIKLASHFSLTLVGLALHRVSLYSPAREKKSVWPPVLRAIGQMKKLHILKLDQISQFDQQWYQVVVDPEKGDRNQRRFYSGKFMAEFCDNVIKDLSVKFPSWADAPVNHHDDDDNDDDDDDDDDDENDEEEEEEEESEGEGNDAGADGNGNDEQAVTLPVV